MPTEAQVEAFRAVLAALYAKRDLDGLIVTRGNAVDVIEVFTKMRASSSSTDDAVMAAARLIDPHWDVMSADDQTWFLGVVGLSITAGVAAGGAL